MITTPTWATIPTLGATATKNVTGLDQANLYSPGNLFPAEHLNQFTYWFANNANVGQSAVTSILAENQNAVTATGQSLAPADNFQLIKTIIAMSHQVGELINTEVPLAPAIWTSGSANYVPVIKRWDSDHDVTSAQAPDLVTTYRAATSAINGGALGAVSSWAYTASGSVITVGTGAAAMLLLNLLANEAIANGYIATQTVGAAALYTGTAQRCVNAAGTDYAITSLSTGAGTITVSGTPAASGTILLYPYRVAGQPTWIRLPRLSGFVGVSQYDYDGAFVAGFRKMDQFQGHYHQINLNSTPVAYISGATFSAGPVSSFQQLASANALEVGSPKSDNSNGTQRTGKTTQPQTYSLYPHTWCGRLLA